MGVSVKNNEIKTLAYVLRRTNYAEADRILNLITPEGKIAAMARGVRKAKSKLAGGVEMFTLSELNIHMGRGEMGTVTSARMIRYYDKIVGDFSRMELAAMMLKNINIAAEQVTTDGYFKVLDVALSSLNRGVNMKLVESWFLLNFMRVSGEEVNLYRDENGGKLIADGRYDYNTMEGAFMMRVNGRYGASEIKLLRLMLTADLAVVEKVKGVDVMLAAILNFARTVSKSM